MVNYFTVLWQNLFSKLKFCLDKIINTHPTASGSPSQEIVAEILQ